MPGPDIFLSYNREDQAVARCFADGFAAAGLKVWWDTDLRSGQSYDEVTESALRQAKAVVVLWSPRSVVSRWVRAEATLADRAKTLVPVTIEPCERPIMFELTQTADLSQWAGNPDDRTWQAFLSDVRMIVQREVGLAEPAPEFPGDATPAPPPPPTSKRGERGGAPSLAVLPFTNRSGLSDDEVFAFGMVEDLTEALSHGVNIRVLSSMSTARFRTGPLPDLEAMGRELGVRYLLEGNVRRSGDQLRVTAQLVEAKSGEILWTQRFDRPLADMAALQEELIEELAAQLGTQVYRIAMEQALKKPGDLTAWECCMRGIAAMRRLSGENLAQAMGDAAQAVEIAPNYGLAHALLAHWSALAYQFMCTNDPAEAKRIRHHIDRALACDGDSAVVLGHVSFALMYSDQAGDAVRWAERAIEANPGFGFAQLAAGIACPMLGLPEKGLQHMAAFRRIEPQSPYLHYALNWEAVSLLALGDWETAAQKFDASLTLNSQASYSHWYKALLARQLGDEPGARQAMIEARRLEPTSTAELWELRLARWGANNASTPQLVEHHRALWAETEVCV